VSEQLTASVLIDKVPLASELFKCYDIYHVDLGGSWSTSLVGSGVLNKTPLFIQLYTGTTVNSSVLAVSNLYFKLASELNSKLWELLVKFHFSNPATGYIRIQIKNNANLGTLASGDYGIEFELQYANAVGKRANGGAVSTVSLQNSLTTAFYHELKIVKRSASALDFYIDDVLLGSLTSGVPTSNLNYLVLSTENGSTALTSYLAINKIEFRVRRI
jgi:hypothetical protein